MKLHVDKNADALYLRLDDSVIVESAEVSPGVVLDYNESNERSGSGNALSVETLVQSESLHLGIRDRLAPSPPDAL